MQSAETVLGAIRERGRRGLPRNTLCSRSLTFAMTCSQSGQGEDIDRLSLANLDTIEAPTQTPHGNSPGGVCVGHNYILSMSTWTRIPTSGRPEFEPIFSRDEIRSCKEPALC